jgi:glycosyltransferase involved in cell wall biosynthesis
MPEYSPKVSVIITCHDLGRYLGEAVDSVLGQTLRGFEIIVVDDASTDEETAKIITQLETQKIRVIRVEKNRVSAARNCGIRKARGEYICCLDADDLLERTFLEKTSAILDKEARVGFVGCWYELFGEESGVVRHTTATLVDFLCEDHAPPCSLFRKGAWEKSGGFEELLKGCEDWEFWINLLAHGYRCHIIQEPLYKYRVREGSKSQTTRRPENRAEIMEVIVRKHRDLYRENIIPVLKHKERLVAELLDWTKEQDAAKRWLLERDVEHEKYIGMLRDAIAWHVAEIEKYEENARRQQIELERRAHEVSRLGGEIQRLLEYASSQGDLIARQQQLINVREHELRSVYSSKAWKLGCAFQDARRSLRAAILLPFRVADLACPGSVKRAIRRMFFIAPGEVIRKNIHKFPYRFLDRALPGKLKERIPFQVRNLARAAFRTTDERIFRQKRWDGPLVSVIIPCYNYGAFLEEALASVRAQTFPNREIIIVDDGSTDVPTRDVLKEIESRRLRGVRVVHQTNQGVAAARNTGISLARGKYICCLDADDTLAPEYLEKCLTVLEGENLDVCYSYFKVFGDEEWIARPGEFDVETLKLRNCASVAAVFKRSAWEKAGGYNPAMRRGYEDWDFWISIAERGGVGKVIPEALFHYRRHGRTMLADAEMHHAVLYAQIKMNHPRLFRENKYTKTRVRYRVLNPLVNIPQASKRRGEGEAPRGSP